MSYQREFRNSTVVILHTDSFHNWILFWPLKASMCLCPSQTTVFPTSCRQPSHQAFSFIPTANSVHKNYDIREFSFCLDQFDNIVLVLDVELPDKGKDLFTPSAAWRGRSDSAFASKSIFFSIHSSASREEAICTAGLLSRELEANPRAWSACKLLV